MELTKEHFDQAVKGLATQASFAELAETVSEIKRTVDSHTAALDGLAKDVKTLLGEKAVSAARFERLEKWAQQVGQKLDIKLEL